MTALFSAAAHLVAEPCSWKARRRARDSCFDEGCVSAASTWRHASLPDFTCRFNWAPNSMVLWDNRSTQHKPVNDFFPAARRLHGVVSEGDQPY